MNAKSDQIRALRAKAADTSLSHHERAVSKQMADKLVVKHGEPTPEPTQARRPQRAGKYADDPTLGPEEWWTVPVKAAATRHPDYKSKIADPLESWGCKLSTRKRDNVYIWLVKNRELADLAGSVMLSLALQQVRKEQREESRPTKKSVSATTSSLYKYALGFLAGILGMGFILLLI